jgi:hypothetical protein
MSVRTITGAGLAGVAILAFPTAGSARPAQAVDRPASSVSAPAVQSTDPVVIERHGGADVLTVVIVAGGTLLVGAAGGFGSGRIVTRRDALRS